MSRSLGRAPEGEGGETAAQASSQDDAALDPRAREVLDVWFGTPDSPQFGRADKRWFRRDARFDAMLRERFGRLIDAGLAGALDTWTRTPLGTLALVIVLDQFSRNVHRDTARAFAADDRALALARTLVASGADRTMPSLQHRLFVYLPYEHSESREVQRESVQLFEQLSVATGDRRDLWTARRHAEIVERFGRFPHRNAALGRETTPDEAEFLKGPRSSF